MRAEDTKAIARRWVGANLAARPGFRGTLWHGSVLALAGDAPVDPASDLDILVLFDAPPPDIPRGKQLVDGVLLDITVLPWDTVSDPETVLANHHLAPSVRSSAVLADPDGTLGKVCARIEAAFGERRWVEARTDTALAKVRSFLAGIEERPTFTEQVMSWLFGTGVTTHVLLVAGMRNPTVRTRYLAVRDLLETVGMPQLHEELLGMLGSAGLTPERAAAHLDALEPAFTAASAALRTPVFFASDLSAAARPIAIDGSRAMISRGDHREAMFWVAVTWTRCMQVLQADALDLASGFAPEFRAMLADLGIQSVPDLRTRANATEAALPRLREIAAEIMDRTASQTAP